MKESRKSIVKDNKVNVYVLDDHAESEYYLTFITGVNTVQEALKAVCLAMQSGAMYGIERTVYSYLRDTIFADYDGSYFNKGPEANEEVYKEKTKNTVFVKGLPTIDGKHYGIDMTSRVAEYISGIEFMDSYDNLTESLTSEAIDALIAERLTPFMCDRAKLIISDELESDAFKLHSIGSNIKISRPDNGEVCLSNFDWGKIKEDGSYLNEEEERIAERAIATIGADAVHEYTGFMFWGHDINCG